MIDFKSLEDRGLGLIAVFIENGKKIVLKEESLRIRMQNLERNGMNTVVEAEVLNFLVLTKKSINANINIALL